LGDIKIIIIFAKKRQMKTELEICLRQLQSCSLPDSNKMIKGVPLSVLQGLSPSEATRFLRTDTQAQYDLLHSIYHSIEAEKERLIKDYSSFYFNKITYTDYSDEGLSPQEIWQMIVERIIRVMRLTLVFAPDYSQSRSANKPQGAMYDMVKINWIDDNGKKFRKVTKTYGKLGQAGLEYAIPKLLETYFDNHTEIQLNVKTPSGMLIDLVANINNQLWAFEFKATNKKNLIETGVRLELWKMYKERYSI